MIHQNTVFAAISSIIDDKSLAITENTPLLGKDAVLDSMKLVELCLMLEDKAAEMGFTFDWVSASAMSTSRGMFRTAGTLAAEFFAQQERSA